MRSPAAAETTTVGSLAAVHGLGEFLRTRRDRLTPAAAGITPFPGPRRVPGLRVDELAVAAGLSVDHYRRIEQGHRHPSAAVLDALARALALDDAESAHLYTLAATARQPFDAPQDPDASLLRLAAALDHLPVMVVGRRGTVLARNRLLVGVLGAPLEPGTSFVDYVFGDPTARRRIVDWAAFAAATVGVLRREVAHWPGDCALAAMIDRLLARNDDAARWWREHLVVDWASGPMPVAHPDAGVLDFTIEIVTGIGDPDQHLVVYTAPPGSATAELLSILGSWDEPEHLPSTGDRGSRAGRSAALQRPCAAPDDTADP